MGTSLLPSESHAHHKGDEARPDLPSTTQAINVEHRPTGPNVLGIITSFADSLQHSKCNWMKTFYTRSHLGEETEDYHPLTEQAELKWVPGHGVGVEVPGGIDRDH